MPDKQNPCKIEPEVDSKETIDWLSKAYRPTKHIIGHIGDGFLQVKWPNQQCQSTEGR